PPCSQNICTLISKLVVFSMYYLILLPGRIILKKPGMCPFAICPCNYYTCNCLRDSDCPRNLKCCLICSLCAILGCVPVVSFLKVGILCTQSLRTCSSHVGTTAVQSIWGYT
uniref:WAP domain-containing protein n=1 Tax=Laticauda laticaudata TaxID=8630 RepID=A0A8C5RFA7_LATLA